ncbi:MAG TPA: hypothetical protein VFE51_10910 [Verrucomicrobiae bacterium]|nr:hypothetical protein [Verrucomicrobiae bacterium]
MKQRFVLCQRNATLYCQDNETGQQLSLRTKDESEARTLLQARNESFREPHLNLQLARTYLAASDPLVSSRTWQDVMNEILKLKSGSTRVRWECASPAKETLVRLPTSKRNAPSLPRSTKKSLRRRATRNGEPSTNYCGTWADRKPTLRPSAPKTST